MTSRRQALTSIQAHITRQIAEADAILLDLHEFNRDNPDEKPMSADDYPWVLGVDRQRRELRALLETVSRMIESED